MRVFGGKKTLNLTTLGSHLMQLSANLFLSLHFFGLFFGRAAQLHKYTQTSRSWMLFYPKWAQWNGEKKEKLPKREEKRQMTLRLVNLDFYFRFWDPKLTLLLLILSFSRQSVKFKVEPWIWKTNFRDQTFRWAKCKEEEKGKMMLEWVFK